MRVEDLIKIHTVTVDRLSAQAEKDLIPDHEYTWIVQVIISAGLLVLRSEHVSEQDQRRFETEIYKCAKEKWLTRCESQIRPDEDKLIEMKRADKAFGYIYKNGRNPKGWPF